jgi:hypothetical protein
MELQRAEWAGNQQVHRLALVLAPGKAMLLFAHETLLGFVGTEINVRNILERACLFAKNTSLKHGSPGGTGE